MTLTVAEIERWDAGDVREVFHAAHTRAQAAFDAADALAALPVLGTWEGQAADAARRALGRTRADLDAHGNDALVVAQAARRAAHSIDGLHDDLARLKVEAAAVGLEVDPSTNRMVPIPGSRRNGRQMLEILPPLQARLNSLVEQAVSVDLELAAAIHLADGNTPMPPAQQVSAAPLPEDPQQFHDLWQRLSRDERDLLYARDHSLGNHPGMPVGDGSSCDADHYNRRHLAEALADARAHGGPHLADLQALEEVLADNPDVKLLMLDTGGRQLHAAFAVGDPDTAQNVSVSTPGLNSSVSASLTGMVKQAKVLRQLGLRQLGQLPDARRGETVAAIGWIGYDAPQIHTADGICAMLAGGDGVSHDAIARSAAVHLARFYDGVSAAHGGKPLNLTAIGHSYGSLTTGLALQRPGDHGVDNAIFYGSPGIEAATPAQLRLQPGHVFTMETPDDPIQMVYDAPPIARAVTPMLAGVPMVGPMLAPAATALLGYAEITDAGEFGPNPATNPNFVALDTGAHTVFDGDRWLDLAEAHRHSDYPQPVDEPAGSWRPRTTNYNIAAVVAGLPDNAVRRR